MMFKYLENEGDKILVFDMRQLNDILNCHINFNSKSDHCVPIPFDYISEKGFSMQNFSKWAPAVIFKDRILQQLNLVNQGMLDKFMERKKQFIFIIATNKYDID